jgi:pimeloyl-ACP methyl ester carboxylesterase
VFVRAVCLGICAVVVAGCSSSGSSVRFAKRVEVAPQLRLWVSCSGKGPVVVADGGLAIPTQAWARVRTDTRGVRFCAFDRAGVGRSDVRACRCGTLERNVDDIHALVRAAELKRPLILVGHSTGGLDALLYARRHRQDVDGLVLVDSPSEAAPAPPTRLADGRTRLDFAAGLRELRHARALGDLPIVILRHGQRAFSTQAAERSWRAMQRQLARDSSNTLA